MIIEDFKKQILGSEADNMSQDEVEKFFELSNTFFNVSLDRFTRARKQNKLVSSGRVL